MINDLTNDLIFDLEFPVYTIENNNTQRLKIIHLY